MMPPYLTPRARALLDDMKGKAKTTIEGAAGPGVDKEAMSGKLLARDPHVAIKMLGVCLSPKLDVRDAAYLDTWSGLEDAGAFSPVEMSLFEHQHPTLANVIQRAYHLPAGQAQGMAPASVRAHAFAQFYNGRTEEGQEGTHLHIGVRRVFERLYNLYSGLASVANRMGFYKASGIFEPAYRSRASMKELVPTMPGEAFPVASNRSKTI